MFSSSFSAGCSRMIRFTGLPFAGLPFAVLPLAVLPFLLGGCDMVVMNPTGDIALQQRNLILFSVGVMSLIIVPVMVLTVLFAWRYRRGNPDKVYDPDFDHSTTLELVIWSCPLLIIIALSAVTWTSTHLLDPFRPLERLAPGVPVPPDAKPLNVQVVALDWKWLFIYPDLGVATVNELALPVNVPVRFSITSTDQFNTFYAPTLAGMIYAMPTMRSELNAVLNKAGDSWGYSGNYSGRGYSDMRFKLRGVEEADFDRWVAEVKAPRAHGSRRTGQAERAGAGDALRLRRGRAVRPGRQPLHRAGQDLHDRHHAPRHGNGRRPRTPAGDAGRTHGGAAHRG
jgi:cytochrome o ubiquinol oxidase subunit II